MGIKAEVGEASIRKVLNDGSGETNKIITNDEELKGKKMPLSLDDEIFLAREALKKRNALPVDHASIDTSDEFRSTKDGLKSDKDLRAENAAVNFEDELKAAKEAFRDSKDLRAEKVRVDVSGDLRAEKEGVKSANNLLVPKEGFHPDGDLKAPKEAVTSNVNLRAPKENTGADTELRAPKDSVKTNSVATLTSLDSLASVRPSTSDAESSATAMTKEIEPQGSSPLENDSRLDENTAGILQNDPEMDFPARVVHLKIENDNLRNKLDKLESAP